MQLLPWPIVFVATESCVEFVKHQMHVNLDNALLQWTGRGRFQVPLRQTECNPTVVNSYRLNLKLLLLCLCFAGPASVVYMAVGPHDGCYHCFLAQLLSMRIQTLQ